ncbi:MAG: divalent-cation tolerance protein CutA [Bythopirellula sp.]
MTDFVLVSTTTASAAEAERIATALVEQRLAACVQIVPQVRSVYRWEGKIEQADERLCLAKTRRSLLPQVEAELLRQHSYECPEIIAVPIEASSLGYLQWLEAQLPS